MSLKYTPATTSATSMPVRDRPHERDLEHGRETVEERQQKLEQDGFRYLGVGNESPNDMLEMASLSSTKARKLEGFPDDISKLGKWFLRLSRTRSDFFRYALVWAYRHRREIKLYSTDVRFQLDYVMLYSTWDAYTDVWEKKPAFWETYEFTAAFAVSK